jgi:hypothetical protein
MEHETRLAEASVGARGDLRDVIAAAGRVADVGIGVFPCHRGEKKPLTRHGFLDSSTSRKQVEQWFHRWPDANLAMATGGTGVDVLDIDARVTGSGFSALDALRRAGLTDGWATIIRTPSGGLHLYYPARPEKPQSSWSDGRAHIDFRGVGGYVLIPPSRIRSAGGRERRYEVVAMGRDPRPLDAASVKSFLRQSAAGSPTAVRVQRRHPGTDEVRIAAWVAARPEGSRNAGLFWAACRLAEQSRTGLEAEAVLVGAALKAGLPETEALATIRSAFRQLAPAAPMKHREGLSR